MPDHVYATITINQKGQARVVPGPLLQVAIFTNPTRPPASHTIKGAIIFNATLCRLQVCTGDRWRTVVM